MNVLYHGVARRYTEVLCLKMHKLEFFKLVIDKSTNYKKPSYANQS